VPDHRRSPIGPALLVVFAAISQEVGAAFAVGLFAALGAIAEIDIRAVDSPAAQQPWCRNRRWARVR